LFTTMHGPTEQLRFLRRHLKIWKWFSCDQTP
jgi:hypothetical protein